EDLARDGAGDLLRVGAWAGTVTGEALRELSAPGWVSQDRIRAWREARPGFPLSADPEALGQVLAQASDRIRLAVRLWHSDLTAYADEVNAEILRRETLRHQALLAGLEDSPLTPEQAAAALSGEPRLLVVAAAGSGKTATLVARAAVAIARGDVRPAETLLLAFNAEAASEIRDRIGDRFPRVGLSATGVTASTFHALALRIVAEATGAEARLADWVSDGDREHLADLIRGLSARSEAFRADVQAWRRGEPGRRPAAGTPEVPPEVRPTGTELSLIRSAIVHAKNNRLDRAAIIRALDRQAPEHRARGERFLRVFLPVFAAWNGALAARRELDFEDLILAATDLVAAGRWSSPFRSVLVDEVQDTSRARAALVRALTREPGVRLTAVGDDWQSVNRFAGADLGIMTHFAEVFGAGQRLFLERTFRFGAELAAASSAFITANPEQLPKRVLAVPGAGGGAPRAIADGGPALRLEVLGSEGATDRAVLELLRDLDRAPGAAGRQTVLLLGRYRKDRDRLRETLAASFAHLSVRFATVHSVKGQAADTVVLVGLTRGGFPSDREDDPVLSLVMPAAERFPHAEERRLFYVALTRARSRVILVTVAGRESPFALELADAGFVDLPGTLGS
ncbi:UvrD-helicase domain-containing protein, partial [Leucobacter sp. M11]|uniref:UvrD-helicase domain-containing protein n=1 Tax=Leucobacter sp. M11 TaxID=2993565 RepID=UPI002D7FF3E9